MLIRIFRRLRSVWNGWRPRFNIPWWPGKWRLVYVDDPPDAPARRRLYVVGTPDDPFQAVMDCPCGCRTPIFLDLVKSQGAQHWRLRIAPNGCPSLVPSVWRVDGCRSHFWLKEGRIRWT
jgi:hypothetical protein